MKPVRRVLGGLLSCHLAAASALSLGVNDCTARAPAPNSALLLGLGHRPARAERRLDLGGERTLMPPDEDVPLDLAASLAAVYEEAAYELSADYQGQPPPPPLSEADQQWWAQLRAAASEGERRERPRAT